MSSGALAQDPEYSFDLSEIEKKPYHLGGFVEFEPILFGLDQDAALYKLRFPDGDERLLGQGNLGLRLDGSVEKGILSAFARAEGAAALRAEGTGARASIFSRATSP